MNAPTALAPEPRDADAGALLGFYEAIERASADMLSAARAGDWAQVMKLEGTCVLLISQLKATARRSGATALDDEARRLKGRIMKRVLVNDAEIRRLAEPWLGEIDAMLTGQPRTLH